MSTVIASPYAVGPLISVVLPTFNRLQYLRNAVDSVFAQTFQAWELIVADDGSSGDTRAYLRTIERMLRVKVIWLQHTGNPGAVRNHALREASGEYIAFLDSDDLWMPTKLERQLAALRWRVDCGWSYTGYARIDETGETRLYPGTRPWVPHQGSIFERLLTFEAQVATPSVMVKRALLEQVGSFDETQVLYEDYDLWLRLAHHSEVVLIDAPLVQLRSHQGHFSGGDVRKLVNRQRMLGKARRFVIDPKMRSIAGRLRAQTSLQLANAHADRDRTAAAAVLLAGCIESWRYANWWRGLPKLCLKLATPRGLLALYRRARTRHHDQRFCITIKK